MSNTLPDAHVALRDSRRAQREADLKLAYAPVFSGDPLRWMRWYAIVVSALIAIVMVALVVTR